MHEELEKEYDCEVVEKKTVAKEGQPSMAYVFASWIALLVGVVAYCIGLYNATMELNEKGYYFAVLVFGLYAAVSLQKTVRDKAEGIRTSNLYYGISWLAVGIAILLLAVGLWNAGSIIRSEKGFYAMSFVLSIFSAITVQKNTRDMEG